MSNAKQDRSGSKAIESSIGERVSEAGEVVGEAIGRAGRAVGDSYEAGREKLHDWQASFENEFHERPVRTVMVIAGIGLVLGFLLRGRNR